MYLPNKYKPNQTSKKVHHALFLLNSCIVLFSLLIKFYVCNLICN